jgi:radical SAM superfamily enzyme with C-terminal helix-hairpin-helix motif
LRTLIIDGYTDEPAGLGVPPYIDVYPRYIAGAIWDAEPTSDIRYLTVDQFRKDPKTAERISATSELAIVVAGVTVPGKYLSGAPATARDATSIPGYIKSRHTIICGPAARFGFGRGGGTATEIPRDLEALYEFVVSGDPECVLRELMANGFNQKTDTDTVRRRANDVNRCAAKGAQIIRQHPCFPDGLICELETFRGCPRSLRGGCSFCTEPLHGTPDFRSVAGIAREMGALASIGAVNFRFGRQPDLLIFGSKDENECPEPNPGAIKSLFTAARRAAPSLKVLHIDNINPATIFHHPNASEEALKHIVELHTPGDVAALGIESTDEEVIRKNNLKVYPEGALFAISVINGIGGRRGENGMPHLLPGLNFVYGLPGETKNTFSANFWFMKKVLEMGLMVRRINMRQLMVMPSTRLASFGDHLARKHRQLFIRHKMQMREEVDKPMLEHIVPTWTVLRGVRTELVEGRMTWSRQIGSYPLLVGIPMALPIGMSLDAAVLSHGPRSVGCLPVPLRINSMSLRELQSIPGIGSKRAATLIRKRPFKSMGELSRAVDDSSIIEPMAGLIDLA